MLITLIVLMIIAIVVVGLVYLINQDTEQVDTNRKYNQIANSAEQTINEYARAYGSYTFNLNSLPSECTQSIDPLNPEDDRYVCTVIDSDYSTVAVDREIEVVDTGDVEDIVILKDESFIIRLSEEGALTGYVGDLEIEWTNEITLEFSLVYEDISSGEYGIIKDIFDAYGVVDSLVSDDPFTDTLNIHPFDFDVYQSTNLTNSAIINLIPTITDPVNQIPRYLVITPRSRTATATELSLFATDPSTFPGQVRNFKVIAYDSSDEDSPVAGFQTTTPLTSQLDSLFNYVLVTEEPLVF